MFKNPRGAPVSATHARFSQPEWGAARKIQAVAPRNDGVTKEANVSIRIRVRPGMSVRLTAQASTVPNTTAMTATSAARISEFRIG